MNTTQKYTEEELVISLKKKEENAFSYLYDNYAGAINGIIFKMVNSVELSEDILQEVFLKIWNNIENYDPSKGRLFTWIVSLTRNLSIDTIRSKSYKKQAMISKDENSVINISDKNYGISKFDTMDLKKKIDQLDKKQKIIIELSYFQGYTQEEIAETLDTPLGTVKSRMRSALIELRKIVN